jgi:hypothetical protein
MPSPPLNVFTFLPISEFQPPPGSTCCAQECKPLHTFSETIAIFRRFIDPPISSKLLLFRSPRYQITGVPGSRCFCAGWGGITRDHPISFRPPQFVLDRYSLLVLLQSPK